MTSRFPSRIRTLVKKVEAAVASGDKDAAATALKAAQPEMARGVAKGVLHKNTVARKYARLTKSVNAIAGTLALLFGIALTRVARVRKRPVEVGVGRLVGEEGEIRRNGYVFVDGELWRARTADGETLVPGQRVRVASVDDGLELVVVGSGDIEERG